MYRIACHKSVIHFVVQLSTKTYKLHFLLFRAAANTPSWFPSWTWGHVLWGRCDLARSSLKWRTDSWQPIAMKLCGRSLDHLSLNHSAVVQSLRAGTWCIRRGNHHSQLQWGGVTIGTTENSATISKTEEWINSETSSSRQDRSLVA